MSDLEIWKNQLRDVGSIVYCTYDDWVDATAQRMVELHEKLIGEKRNPPMQDCDSRLRAIAAEMRNSANERGSYLTHQAMFATADVIDKVLGRG